MKLRNKKTGEIVELDHISAHYSRHYDYGEGRSGEQPCSTWNHSLAELNEEWEDYEEPKEYWYIDTAMMEVTYNTLGAESDLEEFNKQIGNYFATKEEAERAVEKIKAWKRLKDKGFRFTGWKNGILLDATVAGQVRYEFPIDNKDDIDKDLDLLFGGEK